MPWFSLVCREQTAVCNVYGACVGKIAQQQCCSLSLLESFWTAMLAINSACQAMPAAEAGSLHTAATEVGPRHSCFTGSRLNAGSCNCTCAAYRACKHSASRLPSRYCILHSKGCWAFLWPCCVPQRWQAMPLLRRLYCCPCIRPHCLRRDAAAPTLIVAVMAAMC